MKDLKKYIEEALIEEYGKKPLWTAVDITPEKDWIVHNEMPDSSSYKVSNARRKYLHYRSIGATIEESKWAEEVERLENYSAGSLDFYFQPQE